LLGIAVAFRTHIFAMSTRSIERGRIYKICNIIIYEGKNRPDWSLAAVPTPHSRQ